MYFNPFTIQLLAEERIKDAMRQAEQARLIRVVKGSAKSGRWRLPKVLTLKNSLTLFNRPQRKQLTENTPNL